jgi:hypothetical protein
MLQLTKCKECCEKALEAKKMPQEIVMECLGIREQRFNIDLVTDVTESELEKVCTVIGALFIQEQISSHEITGVVLALETLTGHVHKNVASHAVQFMAI